ncbi:MAG: hypothetical protein WA125_04700 [Desulfosporosinus sp.]
MNRDEALGRLLVGAMQTNQSEALTVVTEAISLLEMYEKRFGKRELENFFDDEAPLFPDDYDPDAMQEGGM